MINARTIVLFTALTLVTNQVQAADPKWDTCMKGAGKAAIEACTALINPRADAEDNALAYLSRGATYYNMREYKKADADLTQAIKLYPEGPRAWKTRGKARMWLGDYSQALADLNKALSLPLMRTDDFKEQRADAELWKIIAESASQTGKEAHER